MAYWRLYYHFVWATKNRMPLIEAEFQADLYRVIAAKVQDLEGIVHAVGGMEEHTHLATSVPPKVSLSDFIGQVKGVSSHFVNHVVKPDFLFRWQSEYGVVSFGEKNLPFVVRYVLNQQQHHADNTTYSYLERVGNN